MGQRLDRYAARNAIAHMPLSVGRRFGPYEEAKSIEKTAAHFRWPRVLVTRALAYAKAFPEGIRSSRDGETDVVSAAG
jgi:hypothetical protein